MTDTTQMIVQEERAFMPAMSIKEAVDRYNILIQFTKQVMKDGKDYGTIPGTDKPTLLKPGAEKLNTLFGFAPDFLSIDKIVDFEKGFFYFQYRADLYKDGKKVGSGLGSCNSKEKKYRYRNIPEWKATENEKASALRTEERTSKAGKPYKVLVIENQEPFDLVNTIDKMAQKRALVAATLIAANASEFFTQDTEDLEIIEGTFTEPEIVEQPKAQPKKAAPKAKNGNGGFNPPQALVDANICENIAAAASLLNKYVPNDVKQDPTELIAWGKRYRAWRDAGADPQSSSENATAGSTPV